MLSRTLLMIGLMMSLSGCIITPRIEIPEQLTFDAPMPIQTPMSYDDLLCQT